MRRLNQAFVFVVMACLQAVYALAQETPEGTVSTETFDSWNLTCVTRPDRRTCEINQNIADASGSPLMQLQVGTFNSNGTDITMLARFPVNITTTMPIVWTAGDISVGLTLRACFQSICVADGPISDDVAESLLRTDTEARTRFTITRADGVTASVPLSLTGFSDAWTAMLERTR